MERLSQRLGGREGRKQGCRPGSLARAVGRHEGERGGPPLSLGEVKPLRGEQELLRLLLRMGGEMNHADPLVCLWSSPRGPPRGNAEGPP